MMKDETENKYQLRVDSLFLVHEILHFNSNGGIACQKKKSLSLNVTCITVTVENKEILMLRADPSLPSGNPLHAGRAEHWNHASDTASSSLWPEQKAAMTVVSPGLFRQNNVLFSQSPGVTFPLPQHSWDATEPTQGPHSAIQSTGPHPVAEAAWAGWSIPSALRTAFVSTGRVRARRLYCLAKYIPTSWPWIVSKDIAELFALNEKKKFIVSSYRILYQCTVLNLQVFWSTNITSSCKGAIFKMLRQLTESQPKHV